MSAAPAAEGATPGLLPHRGPSISRMARKWDCCTGTGWLQRRGRGRYRQQTDARTGAAGPKYVIFDLAYGALHRAEYLQYFPLALKQKRKKYPLPLLGPRASRCCADCDSGAMALSASRDGRSGRGEEDGPQRERLPIGWQTEKPRNTHMRPAERC